MLDSSDGEHTDIQQVVLWLIRGGSACYRCITGRDWYGRPRL